MVLVDMNEKELAKSAKELSGSASGRVSFQAINVTDEAAVKTGIKKIVRIVCTYLLVI